MSGTAIIKLLLHANAPVVAAVPVDRIKAGVLPQNITLPAIGITEISSVDRNIPNPASTVHVTERVQVTVMATTYVSQKSIIRLVRKACRDKIAATGYAGVAVLTDGKGPDDFGLDPGIYMQTQDFIVSYSETP